MEDVRGKFRTLTQGQKSENVINLMAGTFRALCDQADWSEAPSLVRADAPSDEQPNRAGETVDNETLPASSPANSDGKLQLHYNIQLILPESRDPKVYDALFASLRRHIL